MLVNVRKEIKPLACATVQAYFSSSFQLYHLLEFILEQTGQANVTVTTFSVSEEFVRKLLQLKSTGFIRNLTMISDHRTAIKALRLSLFTKNVADELHLGNNHSKILLIANDNWRVSVVTSQNQTRGNRIESGMICTVPQIYESLINAVAEEQKKMIDANAVFGRTIE